MIVPTYELSAAIDGSSIVTDVLLVAKDESYVGRNQKSLVTDLIFSNL